MPIAFHKEDIDFNLPSADALSKWIEKIISSHNKSYTQIAFIFCSDEYLLDINQSYLNHDYYTDIITFPYKQGNEIESDIFISIDRVKENAVNFKSDFNKELLRVMAHGILHLLGYKDKSAEDKIVMREQEDIAVDLFKERNKMN